MVRGRYLATFSSKCFAINKNQVAALVAAAVLVAATQSQITGNRPQPRHQLCWIGQAVTLRRRISAASTIAVIARDRVIAVIGKTMQRR